MRHLLALALLSGAASADPVRNRLPDLAVEVRDAVGLTAVGMAVHRPGQPLTVAVSGERERGGEDPVRPTDRWHVGSVTKTLTSTLALVLLGEDGLDTPVPALFDGVDVHAGWAGCTLDHLLTHTAGVPANFGMTFQSVRPETREELVEARREWVREVLAEPPEAPCGERFLYSNLGYTIAGHALEHTTGTAYETLVQAHLADPLGLEGLGWGVPPEPHPVGHQVLWFWTRATDRDADNSPLIAPAGTAHMTLADLANWGAVHLAGDRGAHALLPPDAWQRLHTPVRDSYGRGWVVMERDWAGGRFFWHNGSNTMWFTLLLVLPERDAVFAFTTNDGDIEDAQKAFFGAARELAGLLDQKVAVAEP